MNLVYANVLFSISKTILEGFVSNVCINLGGITVGQGHDTPLGYGQQLFETLSISNIT